MPARVQNNPTERGPSPSRERRIRHSGLPAGLPTHPLGTNYCAKDQLPHQKGRELPPESHIASLLLGGNVRPDCDHRNRPMATDVTCYRTVGLRPRTERDYGMTSSESYLASPHGPTPERRWGDMCRTNPSGQSSPGGGN